MSFVTMNNEMILSMGDTSDAAWAACIRDAAPHRIAGGGATFADVTGATIALAMMRQDVTFATVDDDPSDYGIRILGCTPALAAAIEARGGALDAELLDWVVCDGVADVAPEDDETDEADAAVVADICRTADETGFTTDLLLYLVQGLAPEAQHRVLANARAIPPEWRRGPHVLRGLPRED